MKSKTLIEKHLRKKTNNHLVETILACKKKKGWLEVARILSGSRKNWKNTNLDKINEESKEGEIIVVPGKVLSLGDITKKTKVVALNFSEKAREKLLKSKIENVSIMEEVKKNPEAKGTRILK